MLSKPKHIVALLLALILTFGTLSSTIAGAISTSEPTYSDVPATHWASEAIEKWSTKEAGILYGDGQGHFFPDNAITDIELQSVIARILGTASPEWVKSPAISREAAIAYVAQQLGIAPLADPKKLFDDDADINAEYKPYIYALAERGIVKGTSTTAYVFEPKSSFKRSEILQIVYNTVSGIADSDVTGGTYAQDFVIRSAGVTLKDMVINGDLIIAQGVGDGDVHLSNVTVKGNTIVYGGGKHSIYAEDFRVEGSVIVRKYDDKNKVRIVASGDTNIRVVLESDAIIVTQELVDGSTVAVTISKELIGDAEIELIGDFTSITNNRKNAKVELTGSVQTLNINEPVKVTGKNTITTANVEGDAGKGTELSSKPKVINGAGGSDIKTPSSTSSSGGSRGGGNTGGSTMYQVTFDTTPASSEAQNMPAAQSVAAGGQAERPSSAPTLAGYRFVDWYADEALTTLFNFNTEITAATTIYAKFVPALTGWVGTWNAMTSYFDDPELQEVFSQGAEACSMSVEQLKAMYGALIGTDSASLVIDGNTIKFCSETDGSGTAETITYIYVDEYTLETGDEELVWYEFEGSTDGEYKYLAITFPERDASDQVNAIHYRNSSESFDALFAEGVAGAATFISADSTTEEINNTLSSVFEELAAYFAAAKQ